MVFLTFLFVFVTLTVLATMACFRLPRNAALAVAGSLWLLYASYEYLIYIRALCSGECNIRVDLLVIYPVLLNVTLAAAVNVVRTRRVAKICCEGQGQK
jgi:hypothetical protein